LNTRLAASPKTLVVVGNDQFHAPQATVGETAQEPGPERLGLGGAGGDAQNLAFAVFVDRNGDHHRTADDATAFADLDVGGIEPEIGPRALQGTGQKGVHAFIDLAAQTAHLALGHAARAHGLHQVIHRSGGDALNVGLLDHGHERLLGRLPWLQEARQVAALVQLRDLQRDPTGTGVPLSFPVPLAGC
jgi:hypothetical protein